MTVFVIAKKYINRRALLTISSEDICQLINFILENNVFSHNDEYVLQICGTVMGTRMAPRYANIFMAELEESFLSGYPYKPVAYYRYIDDIFIIWSHGLDLYTISSTALTSNTATSFSFQISPPRQSTFSMSLLTSMEVTLPPRRTQNQHTHTHFLHTTVFTQDTLNTLLSSQFLRYKRICSNDKIFLNDVTTLFKYFLARQYPFSDILHNFNKVKQIDRHKLLSHSHKLQNKNVCLITKFSPKIDHFI